MKLSEFTITEAGFGTDLGAEKFLNIKCRLGGISPDCVVLVATMRALKYHGGLDLKALDASNPAALEKGLENLKKHIENIRHFGLPVVVAINSFVSDTDDEVELVRTKCAYLGVPIVPSDHWARGGDGAMALAETVADVAENTAHDFRHPYPDGRKLWEKVRTIAREIYGADDIMGDKQLRGKFRKLERDGFGNLPICMAKTQYSLSTDPGLRGRPTGFDVPIRDVKVSAGAGFVVVFTGDIMTMPGLPRRPSAESIDFDEDGHTVGLF
jgi:formate--tetrahydrofolate ligase